MNEGWGSLKGRDISESEAAAVVADVDHAICASSFEPRCAAIATSFPDLFRERGTLLLFDESRGDEVRQKNDKWFENRTLTQLPLSILEFDRFLKYAYRLLQSVSATGKRPSLLVDYSSMPKPFYIGLLAVARQHGDCDILFGYDLGSRPLEKWGTGEIDHIYALPGFEGRPTATGCEMVVMSLGFDGNQACGVEEMLQPSRCFSLLADPGVVVGDAQRASDANKQLLEQGATIRSPIRAVWPTVAKLRDLVQIPRVSEGVTVVPLGPKPHALALGILALERPEITYLHVLTRYPPKRRVTATGERVWSEVRFRPIAHFARED